MTSASDAVASASDTIASDSDAVVSDANATICLMTAWVVEEIHPRPYLELTLNNKNRRTNGFTNDGLGEELFAFKKFDFANLPVLRTSSTKD